RRPYGKVDDTIAADAHVRRLVERPGNRIVDELPMILCERAPEDLADVPGDIDDPSPMAGFACHDRRALRFLARVNFLHRQVWEVGHVEEGRLNTRNDVDTEQVGAADDAVRPIVATVDGVRPAHVYIRVFDDTAGRLREVRAEDVGEGEIMAPLAGLVAQRRLIGGNEASPLLDIFAQGRALRIRQAGRIR